MKKYFIHPKALVETKKVGEKSTIWAFTHVLPKAVIGKNVNINDHCFIENDVKIGDNVTIKCGVYLWDGVTVEERVQIGPGVAFVNDKHPRAKNKKYIQLKTLLKKGSSIGANATILGDISIGTYALVGAGSVVTKNVPDFALAYGNPAKVMGHLCVCTKKLMLTSKKIACSCGRSFIKKGKILSLVT